MELPQGPPARSIQVSAAHPRLALPAAWHVHLPTCNVCCTRNCLLQGKCQQVAVTSTYFSKSPNNMRLFVLLTLYLPYNTPVQTVGEQEGILAGQSILLNVLQLGSLQEIGFSSLRVKADDDVSFSTTLAQCYPELLLGIGYPRAGLQLRCQFGLAASPKKAISCSKGSCFSASKNLDRFKISPKFQTPYII